MGYYKAYLYSAGAIYLFVLIVIGEYYKEKFFWTRIHNLLGGLVIHCTWL